MTQIPLQIDGIPALLWGDSADKLLLAVHGNRSHKADDMIVQLAEEATTHGYQVLSFDLPGHGDRRVVSLICNVWDCVSDLGIVMNYARQLSTHISVFACSMGAYFSLIAYREEPLERCLFLSPVVDMWRISENMMRRFHISEAQVQAEGEVPTPLGQTLYWDVFRYVKAHRADVWNTPTSILYGGDDDLCEAAVIDSFTQRYGCQLTVLAHGKHYFRTEAQMAFYRSWLKAQSW
ncbi:MAG: alpha/beta fold hydrolase [Oscillospiraceae bacterium]